MVKECAVCAGLAVISFVLGTAVTTSAMQAPSPSPSAGATTSPTTAASAAATAVPTGAQAKPTTGTAATASVPAKKMYCN